MSDKKIVDINSRLSILQVPTFDDSGGPPYDGGMEARVAKLEAAVEHILRDIGEIKLDLRALREKVDSHFLIVGAMIIALGVGLAGLMAKGFGWL